MKRSFSILIFSLSLAILLFPVVTVVQDVFSNVTVSPVRSESIKGGVYQYDSFAPSVITMVTKINAVPNLPNVLLHISNEMFREQIAAIALAYYPDTLQKVEWNNTIRDVEFTINNRVIVFASGKLIFFENMGIITHLSGIMYPYSFLSLDEMFHTLPAPRTDLTRMVRSSDLQIAVTDDTPQNLVARMKEYDFLNFRVKLHPIAGEALLSVENDLIALSKIDSAVMKFFNKIREISGHMYRKVKGSDNISMHAFGLALDIIPYSYEGKEAYWQWTKDIFQETWQNIPLERRWTIPNNIVDVFQRNGFIWGGKWPNYDTIHFEYRPELIEYAIIRQHTGSTATWSAYGDD